MRWSSAVRVSLLAAVALGLALSLSVRSLSSQDDLAQNLRTEVSAAQGVAFENLRIAARETRNYPLTGVRVHAAKVIDAATGKLYVSALDDQGNAIDLGAARAAEEAARTARFGKLSPRLHARLTAMGAAETVPVSLWIRVAKAPLSRKVVEEPEAPPAREAPPLDRQATGSGTGLPGSGKESLLAQLAQVRDHVRLGRLPVLDALARMGVKARVPLYAPAVFAHLTAAQIEEISQYPEVSAIYGPEAYTLFEDDAGTTERAYRVWQQGNLGFGMSSRPTIHEPDGVADYNPYLNNLSHPVIFWCSNPSTGCPLGSNIQNHATEVAGVIAATHPLFRGVAPSSQLILSANSQNFSDANLVDAFEWARFNGGDPTNMSWGTVCGGFQTFMSRYVDWATKNLAATFVISGGNTGYSCANLGDQKVSAPALAWSVLAVGSQEDDNTGFWSGDSMSTFNKWRNPDFAPGMEKPEVVAVGQNVRTTDAAGGDHLTAVGVNGTSFSAPQVAGQVVQMLARQPGQRMWPETNKAAVLASAYHNIELGTARDGVGAVVMNNSDDTYRFGRFIDDFAPNAASFPRNKLDAFFASAGQRVRVAIAWDSDSNVATSDVLGADIDLRVRHPDNKTTVCESVSFQNAWELCEFTAPASGFYDILINLFNCPDYVAGCSAWPGTFLGIAWSFGSIPNFCTGAISVSSTPGTKVFSIDTANGSTFFDSYPGFGFPQPGRERVLQLVLPTTRDITFADTNPNLDLLVLQFPSCTADPIVPTVVGAGLNSVSINNAAPGTYWLVVDGFAGTVGTTTASVSITGP